MVIVSISAGGLLGAGDPYAGIAIALVIAGVGALNISYCQRVYITSAGFPPHFFGMRAFDFPLDQILSAGCIDINALAEFGGVGYRTSLRSERDGIVIGSGPAFIFQCAGRRDFVLSVDEPCAAARVLARNI